MAATTHLTKTDHLERSPSPARVSIDYSRRLPVGQSIPWLAWLPTYDQLHGGDRSPYY